MSAAGVMACLMGLQPSLSHVTTPATGGCCFQKNGKQTLEYRVVLELHPLTGLRLLAEEKTEQAV